MHLNEVKQVKQVVGEHAANAALAEGWALISVVTYNPSVSSSGVSSGASVTYVLGKPAEPEKGRYDDKGEFVSEYDPFAPKP